MFSNSYVAKRRGKSISGVPSRQILSFCVTLSVSGGWVRQLVAKNNAIAIY